MNSKYKTVIIITSLLVVLSISISTINYFVSLNNAQEQLKTQSLPLSLDNIYTDIQKHIIQPYLVSSMMANDTFVQDWIIHDEQNGEKIVRYLEAIKNKYEMFNTFLVSDKTKNYYTQEGLIEKVRKDNPANKWYFEFKNIQNKHEINLDFNEHMSNKLIMFINYKIFDDKYRYLGATGVALKISYINDMLKHFRINHSFIVTFFNENGDIILSEKDIQSRKNIDDIKELKNHKDTILSKDTHLIEYKKDGSTHMLNTKYIPELDLYLAVDANLEDFTKNVKRIFYFNILVSLIITTIIAIIIYFVIRKYSKKLEYLSSHDTLTNISNRRSFEEKLQNHILIQKRAQKELALIFVDIDDFKFINDDLGHEKGDEVLKLTAKIFKTHIRQTDLIARWGGEEFIIALTNLSLEDAKDVAEKLRSSLENNSELNNILNKPVTGSFGLTMLKDSDTLEQLVSRADEAMYDSKNSGKNRITTL